MEIDVPTFFSGDACWAKIPGLKVWWPVKLVDINETSYTVYCNSDNVE